MLEILTRIFRRFRLTPSSENAQKLAKKTVATALEVINHQNHANENPIANQEIPGAADSDSFMNVRSFGITDVGLERKHNEDSIFRSDELGIYLVADGMGGHAAGEVASGTSVKVIADFADKYDKDSSITWPYGFDTRLSDEGNALITGIQLANHSLVKMQQERTELHGMGTTIAALRVTNDQALIAHVGDSRVYRFRNSTLELLTNDHSWVNEQLQKKIITAEEARTHRYRNVITRALGNRLELEIDVRLEPIQENDTFLICSDGLSSMIDDSIILELFSQENKSIRDLANALVARANEAGGHDNISVMLINCTSSET